MKRSPIAKLLAEALEETGMKASELCRKAGVSKQYLSDIINDKEHPISKTPPNPSREFLKQIADALNKPVNLFLEACGYQTTVSELAALKPKVRLILEMAQEMNEHDLNLSVAMVRQIYKQRQPTNNLAVVDRIAGQPIYEIQNPSAQKSKAKRQA